MPSPVQNDAASPAGHTGWGQLWPFWLILAWMAGLFFASTDHFSPQHTGRFIMPVLRWLFPNWSEQQLDFAHLMTRKGAHLMVYAVMALLGAYAFSTARLDWLRKRWFVAALAVVAAYAATDEFHQSFVPSRTASVHDVLLDICGGLIALTLFALWRMRRAHRTGLAPCQSRQSEAGPA